MHKATKLLDRVRVDSSLLRSIRSALGPTWFGVYEPTLMLGGSFSCFKMIKFRVFNSSKMGNGWMSLHCLTPCSSTLVTGWR
ncbi:hypothetical protein AMTR_s00145p00058350 [Amborella trichopoda]|uniref:Uncharacterized protein n=1 Tax=Amborella trichopoda TaxID=13333 RepID=W1P7T4_AMBTC|nr:hypothetical protein AMTR_s00145p00058350 [Amborella trichopoda]